MCAAHSSEHNLSSIVKPYTTPHTLLQQTARCPHFIGIFFVLVGFILTSRPTALHKPQNPHSRTRVPLEPSWSSAADETASESLCTSGGPYTL